MTINSVSKKRQRGQAIIEFALLLPLFCILLLGGVDLYMAVGASNNLSYVAEESARCLGTRNVNCQNSATLTAYVQKIGAGVGLTNASTLYPVQNTDCPNCISVTVSYPFVPLFAVPYIPVIQMARTAQFSTN